MDMAKPNMGGGGDGAKPDHHTPSRGSNNNKVYKGVRKRKWGKWVSEIRLPNSRERIWLGSYDSPEKAARAFDAALYCLRGCRANFNFPDTPINLDINRGDQSLTPQEIQEVAARFAKEVPRHDNQEEPSQLSQRAGANSSLGSFDSKAESTYTTTTTTASSSSTTMYECDGTVKVDHGDNNNSGMDWTFLNELGDCSEDLIGSDYGLYSSALDRMHSGELLYSTPPPPLPFEDNADEIDGDYDPFSHQSFLWNWN